MKGRTQTFFKQSGTQKKAKDTRCMMGLQKRLQKYFILNQHGLDFSNEIKQVKEEMSAIAEIKSKGIIVRSKGKEIGEKCSRYFF